MYFVEGLYEKLQKKFFLHNLQQENKFLSILGETREEFWLKNLSCSVDVLLFYQKMEKHNHEKQRFDKDNCN